MTLWRAVISRCYTVVLESGQELASESWGDAHCSHFTLVLLTQVLERVCHAATVSFNWAFTKFTQHGGLFDVGLCKSGPFKCVWLAKLTREGVSTETAMTAVVTSEDYLSPLSLILFGRRQKNTHILFSTKQTWKVIFIIVNISISFHYAHLCSPTIIYYLSIKDEPIQFICTHIKSDFKSK